MNLHAALAKTGLSVALASACVAAMADATAFEITPQARLHLDYAAHDADVKPMEDDFLLRRAYFGVEGKFNDDWSFEATYGFSDVDPSFKDVSDDGEFKTVAVEYEGWQAGDVSIGQFKVPFGMEEMQSSNNISFAERSLPVDAFKLSRRLGVGLDRNRDRYTLAAMVFGGTIDDGDVGQGAATRFTFTPVRSDQTVLHLGLALSTEAPRGDVDFDTRPESRVADVKFVNTGNLDHVDRINRLGLEAAWQSGPLSVRTEWMRAEVDRHTGSPDASLDGWYVAGSWVLTGESRGYKNGVFKGIKASRPGGAWELSTRYSHINLDDGRVRGGEEDNFTLGLNYYANRHLRIMANYIKVSSQRRGKSDDPAILLLRVQIVL